MRGRWAWMFAALLATQGVAAQEPAVADADANTDANTDSWDDARATLADEAPDEGLLGGQWLIGPQYRYVWVPGFIQELFFDITPTVANHAFGLVVTHRDEDGFSAVIGLGYTGYGFSGPYRLKDEPDIDTEFVKSDLGLLHATSAFLWSAQLHPAVAFEYGFGVDFGLVLGDVVRNEAYPDDSAPQGWRACAGKRDPVARALTGNNEHCADPDPPTLDTNAYNERGEQYNVVEKRVPPVFAGFSLPQLGFRFQPHEHVVFKIEAGFGIWQFWAGASLYVGFEAAPRTPLHPVQIVERPVEVEVPAPPPPPPPKGHVQGRVLDRATSAPISGASVRFVGRELSELQTSADGAFVSYELDPGIVNLEVTHEDYDVASCGAVIPEVGGDVSVECLTSAKPRVGELQGKVVTTSQMPIAGARVELSGPTRRSLLSNATGEISARDLPPGRYQLKVDADGYLIRVQDVDVIHKQTASVSVPMFGRPRRPMVEVKKKEVRIRRQISFVAGSPDIEPNEESLLSEIADVLLRTPRLLRIEIQGHTDNQGARDANLELSQQRADAVRTWLVAHGVGAERLDAKGYGDARPLRANITASGRSANRRVQLVIVEQSE